IAAGAGPALRKLAELTGIHVVTTLMARGSLPDDHPLCLGMPGMHGNYTAVTSMQRADLLIALGTRFDDRVTGKLPAFATEARVIHADIDPAEIGKNRRADVPIVGDARLVIEELLSALKAEMGKGATGDYAAWTRQLDEWRSRFPYRFTQVDDGLLKPQFVISRISDLTGGDCIYVAGVGPRQMWASQFIRFHPPRTSTNSVALGASGFCVP